MQAGAGREVDIDDEEDEEMTAAERDLADDAQWKLIQKNTFTRWANEHLKSVNKHLTNMETDFSDGLRLVALIEVLAGKKFKKYNKRPTFRTQKLENVTMSLQFLEEDEGIKIVNIDSGDIVDKKLKLILGLIWTLILHYSISMPMWEGEEQGPSEGGPTPKQRLLNWIQSKVPDLPIKNFTTDWNDGKAIGALVDAVGPGLCPDWEDWDPKNKKANAKDALDAAEKWLDVPQLIKPEEMTNPKVDEMSMMTYLSQFPNAKLKPGAPTRPRLNVARVRAYGPGIEPKGNQMGAPARFTIETFSAGKGSPEVQVLNPKGKPEPCEIVANNDRNMTYSCVYVPSMEGVYKIIIKFAGKEIPKSPYKVTIEGAVGDPTKVTAKGPGIEKSGVIATKRTYFEVFTKNAGKLAKSSAKDAGKGQLDVVILDPHGRKDTIRPSIQAIPDKPGTFRVEYTAIEPGVHSVNIFFVGTQIPNSPYGVSVAAPSNAKQCYATGRGIQPRGIRVKDTAVFRVHTKGAGDAQVTVQIIGPGGTEVKCTTKKLPDSIEPGLYECTYFPQQPGNYIINISFGEQPISKSPYRVEVSKYIDSKIIAYGPGLEGGVVNQPAVFTVETNGETGSLGFSIEGPSQAKIDCKDNGDGSADVTYYPTVAGEYAVHVLCNNEDIPKSPYMVEISPAAKFDASKVTAAGPGLQANGVVISRWAEFTIDTKKAGAPAPTKVTCLDVELKPVEVQVKDNRDGTFSCKYMPRRPVKHTVIITYGGVQIPNSPYRVYVSEPSTPSKVKVYGPGVEKGVKTLKPTYFTVDCKEAGPGDVGIALTDAEGKDVPLNTIDNQDATFRVEYEPKTPGVFTAQVYFAEQEIPKSPIKIKVDSSIDLSKVKVEGLEPTIPVGQEREVAIVAPGQKAEAKILVTTPSKQTCELVTTDAKDKKVAQFALQEPGPHVFDIGYGGLPVPGSPFHVQAVPAPVPVEETMGKAVAPAAESGAPGMPAPEEEPNVKAYGPGLEGGQRNKPAHFTIDTREAKGPGGLGISVEGPAESKIDCKDNQNGTCDVTYLPEVPGDYKINVLYAEKHIKNSPFTAKITDAALDISGVFAEGPGLSPDGVYLDSPTGFTVNAKSVTPVGSGKVRAIITNPAGTKNDSLVTNNNDGTYGVLYTPFEEGKHQIDVTYDEMEIPKSPFVVQAKPGCDPNRVRAYGPGLEKGLTNQNQEFTVDIRGAGQGSLGLAVEGPAEAKMTCNDNRDGTCTVQYVPVAPGDYDITVKFADKPIPGSPFRVPVKVPLDPSKVKVYGPGVDTKGVRADQPATFTIDTTQAGEAPLECTLTDQNGLKKPVDLVPINEGLYNASYVPETEGKLKVDVNYANQSVPHSPFQTRVLPSHDASKVKVSGPGVTNGAPASLPTQFTIDTTEAGVADLQVLIQRPDGSQVRPKILDNNDGTFTVEYTPEDVDGPYKINVKFGGQNVPGAPFEVQAKPIGDASKCKITEAPPEIVPINKETVICVDASQAGDGKVTCRILTPTGSDMDIDIIENRDGTFSIQFTPQYPGDYSINIKFGGEKVPQGDYQVKAVSPEEYERLRTVGEELISKDIADRIQSCKPGDSLFQPVDFRIPVGPIFNFVSAYIIMHSGKKAYPKVEDNKDGTVTIRYQPTEVGLHELYLHYNNELLEGCPFKFHVDTINSGFVTAYGPGLSHGVVNEPATFTIVTKDAGAGGLSLAIEGPSKTEIKCNDNGDGTCTVSYVPTAPGEYTIVVKFTDKHISGSPFTAKITPGEPRKRAQLSVGTSSEVSLKVTETDIANLSASIKGPSGREEPCILKRLDNGHLGISFTPREIGEHLVSVYRNGTHIANSPFSIKVGESEIGNASKVKVYGKGLENGMANEVNEFIVDSTQAGFGGLSLSIEGPSKADIECHDMEDGTCRVTYKPTEPGTYIINIKFADQHVPGSPFSVNIGGEGLSRQTERITRHREAADITHIGSQCELSLKIPGTNPFDMTASVTSPAGTTELCDVASLDDSRYSIKFVPKEMGVHTVSVKHKDMHIPGSPFEFTVGPITGGGAHKVHASGPGLNRGEVGIPGEFNIYTREAGAGGLSIAVEGPSKAELDFEDRKDGSCGVNYSVTEPGEYFVTIKFNDEHIPDSPFRVLVSPSIGDARKLSVTALQEKGLQVGKPAAFVVNFNGAKGKLQARVVSPSGTEDEALIQEIDDGEYAVRFIPRENGPHLVHVMFDGCHIPDSPFRILVGKVDADPGRVTACGDGLVKGNTGQVCKFMVNTLNAGAGALAVTVEGPSKVKLECKEVDEGYEFSYTPTAPGDYFITIRYSGVHIAGSPFKAKIEGQGQASALQEQASVVVETVTKSSTTTRFASIGRFHSDATKVAPEGAGLKKAFRGKTSTFMVDASKAGNNILFIGMVGPKSPCEDLSVKHQGNNVFKVVYIVKEQGNYMLSIKWGDDHIPGSPYCVEVN